MAERERIRVDREVDKEEKKGVCICERVLRREERDKGERGK